MLLLRQERDLRMRSKSRTGDNEMKTQTAKKIRMSASQLGLFKDCPRCFWYDRSKKIARPRGIFPSLPGGMDLMLKTRYDAHRNAGKTPPEIGGLGLYRDQERLEKMRNWRTGLTAQVGEVEVFGAFDDIGIEPDSLHSPLDYKTRGSAPKEGTSEGYYGHQMDLYALLMDANMMPTSGKAHLVYYWPGVSVDGGTEFPFQSKVVTLATSIDRIKEMVEAAFKVMAAKTMPDSSTSCEYCSFARARDTNTIPF